MARRMIHMPADTDLNRLFDAWTLANKVLAEQGLAIKGWKVVFDNTKSRAGQCRYGSKELGLSAHLMAIWEWDHVRNVILHEIAHILVPAKRGNLHGWEWKAKFIELGGNGKRTWGSDGEARIQGGWVGRCPNGHEVHRRRMTKTLKNNRHSCKVCAGSAFDARYLITWEENK